MLHRIRKSVKGFTLVEVIVVAVIVAVLALVAIQLYRGYVAESRRNTAENLAAAAAGFLNSAYNINPDWNRTPADLTGGGADTWSIQMPNATASGGTPIQTTFTCPKNAKVEVVGNNVSATVSAATGGGGSNPQKSSDYAYTN